MSALRSLCSLMVGLVTCHASWIQEITCASNEDCTVSCSGANSCSNFIINCSPNTNCHIQCDDTESCKGITVNAPINHELSIYCGGMISCFNATFNAPQASSLTVEGCQDDQSCLDLTIYCPPRHLDGTKNCFIEGNDNLGSYYEWRPMHLYARNGWLDIDIDYNGTFNNQNKHYFHVGVMHCTNASQYDMQCAMSVNAWSCRNPHDYCNHPTPLPVINSTSTVVEDTPPKKDLISDIDLNKILLPLILSLVLIACLIGAACVWYKILCVKSKNKEKKAVVSNPLPPIVPVPDNVKDKSDITVIRRPSQPASVISSQDYRQDSPALSSIGAIYNPNRNEPAKINMRHTFDIGAELQHASAEHIRQSKHRHNASGPFNAHKQTQHKKREASLSSLAPPSRQRRQAQANRGSLSSHDRSRSGASNSDLHHHHDPFIMNDLEGSGIKDAAEYDPEGFSINQGDDIEDADIESELPESPQNGMMDSNDDSHSEIYLDSSHHPGQTTPKLDAMSDLQSNPTSARFELDIVPNEEQMELEGSGSDDMYINNGNAVAHSPMGVPHLPAVPQRVHKMSMDIATDVSVGSIL